MISTRERTGEPAFAKSEVRVTGGAQPEYEKNHITFVGAPPGTRTLDPLIKSQLLYQLS